MGAPLILFIFITFAQLIFSQESTLVEPANLESNCLELKRKKKKVLQTCNKSWKKWGVDPVPKQNELINPHSCQSTFTEKEIKKSLSGCAQGFMAWPATIATLPVYGLAMASKIDGDKSKSRKHILTKGTLEEIKRLFTKDLMRKHCGIAQGEESEYISKKCKNWGHQLKKVDCNPFLKDVRKSRKCIHSAKFRRTYRAERPLIEEKAQEAIQNQERKAAQKRRYDSAVREISKKCGLILNPYRRFLLSRIASPTSYFYEAKNLISPGKSTIKRYNQCIQSHPKATPGIKAAMNRSSAGWYQKLLGHFQSLKCYNPEMRSKIICELAADVGIVGGVSKVALKKLGRPSKSSSLVLNKENLRSLGLKTVKTISGQYRLVATNKASILANYLKEINGNGVKVTLGYVSGKRPFSVIKKNGSVADIIINPDLINMKNIKKDRIEELFQAMSYRLHASRRQRNWLREQGVSTEIILNNFPDATSLRITKIDPHTKDPILQLMRKRMKRDKVDIVIDDPDFNSPSKRADAFASGTTIHLRGNFFSHHNTFKKNTFSHELRHVKNNIRCMKKLDCTGTIGFRSLPYESNIPQKVIDGNRRLPPSSKPLVQGGYKDWYRTDELEAWEQGYRFGERRDLAKDGSKNISKRGLQEGYSNISRFFNQRSWLKLLRDQIKSGQIKIKNIQGERFQVIHNHRKIEISFDYLNKDFGSVEEAKEFYVDTLTKRLSQLENRKKAHEGFKRKIKGQ